MSVPRSIIDLLQSHTLLHFHLFRDIQPGLIFSHYKVCRRQKDNVAPQPIITLYSKWVFYGELLTSAVAWHQICMTLDIAQGGQCLKLNPTIWRNVFSQTFSKNLVLRCDVLNCICPRNRKTEKVAEPGMTIADPPSAPLWWRKC